MLSTSVPSNNMNRSSLEEMLEAIKKRDERPKDVLPALPVRPISKARLPSARRSLPNNFKMGEPITPPTTVAVAAQCLVVGVRQKEGKKREKKLSREDREMGFECNGFIGNKMSKVKVVPLVEAPYVENSVDESNHGEFDLFVVPSAPLQSTEECKLGGNAESVLEKEFQVWCQLSNGQWELGKIESASVDDAVVMLSDGNIVTVPRGNSLPANPDILESVNDLTWLSFLNEPSVLHNLECRYYEDKIYTKSGRVLVAINPFKDDQFHQKEYLTRQKLMDPHVYATAEAAYNEMMSGEEKQSIIVSGESGAGKTEVAEMAIQYLAALGGESNTESKILKTNYILEAFGNAKTSINHNSSRFGKLIEIQFSATGRTCGARVETFLLEKSRVVQLDKGERSYHIFYQLCCGAPSLLKERLNLKSPSEFDYLKQSDCLTVDNVDDARRFHMLTEALDSLQISKEDQENAFAMLSAVLWMGNISFQTINNGNHVEVIKDEAVSSASKLMGCNIQDLMLALSTRHVQTDNANIVQKLTLQEAIDTRDALAKSIYANLFDWLLSKLNKSLKTDKQEAWSSISIIDICGFDRSQKNSFEQLLVNYANERLQQHLSRHLFKLEQEEYQQDGIYWTRVDFDDNQECLNLFEQMPHGLLSLLEEESSSAQATDSTLANKLKDHLSCKPCFNGKKDGAFSVCHYAGEVLYNTSGFLKKNRDFLHSDSIQLLSSCTYQVPQLFASTMLKPLQMPMRSFNAIGSQIQNVGTKFKDQLFRLMQQLETTNPHIIYCIKPNNKQLPGVFEKDLVLQQLRSCAIIDAARMSKLGYPTRMSHQKFVRRYGLLHPENGVPLAPLNKSVAILQQLNIQPDSYQVGYTKLFFRAGQVAKLEEARKSLLQCIIKVQKCFRGHLGRRHFIELTKRRLAQQSSDQAKNMRKDDQVLTQRLITESPTDNCLKQQSAKEKSSDRVRAVILLQSVIRGWLVRKHSHDKSTPEQKVQNLEQELPQIPASIAEELQRKVLAGEAALKQKEDENVLLRQQLKQLQIRRIESDARMKTLEETWQKQMASLQMSLATAKNSLVVDDTRRQSGRPDSSPLPHYYDSEDTTSAGTRTPRTPTKLLNHVSHSTPGRESNGSLNAVSHLVKELEQRKQVFNNDVKILVEVKSGQSGSTGYSYEDLKKVKKNFEAWKKEFKAKISETKRILKRGNPDDKVRKTWWGMKSTRKT